MIILVLTRHTKPEYFFEADQTEIDGEKYARVKNSCKFWPEDLEPYELENVYDKEHWGL